MKLPSLELVLQESVQTLRRFPFVLAVAAAGTLAALILIETEDTGQLLVLYRVLYTAVLGIPLCTALAIGAEKENLSRARAALLNIAGCVLLVLYGVSLPEDIPAAPGVHGARLAVLAVGMHLMVAVLPWMRSGENNGFWQYNKTLFLRAITTGLYTGVLFAGLAIALAALDNLFGIDIHEKRYGEVGVMLLGMFTPWFFLAGVPEDLSALDADTTYPKGLKVFAQYIVFPLAMIYLVILYAYIGKLLISWDWPRGWVSKLILGFAGAGTFTLLLLHPIRDAAGNIWIRNAWRWYHLSMIPLIVMLFLAVWRRISEYGITEGRYLAIALGVWGAAMVVYYLFSRGKNIKAIPLTLCVLALLVSYGPWGAFSVPERDQITRLESLLQKNGMLKEGKAGHAAAAVSFEDAREISSLLSYLHTMYGYEGIQQWFSENLLQNSSDGRSGMREPQEIAKLLGIEYVSGWARSDEDEIAFEAGDQPMSLDGFQLLLPTQYYSKDRLDKEFQDAGISIRASEDLATLTVTLKRQGMAADSARVDMGALASRVMKSFARGNTADIPPDSMAAIAHGTQLSVRVVARMLVVQRDAAKGGLKQYRVEMMYSVAPDSLRTAE